MKVFGFDEDGRINPEFIWVIYFSALLVIPAGILVWRWMFG